MRELLLFILGNIIAIFYFSHLYWQLGNLTVKRKIPFYFTFAVRFSLLSLLLGSLFFFYGAVAVYCIIGIFTGRFLTLYWISGRG
jgi:hypothetical protein